MTGLLLDMTGVEEATGVETGTYEEAMLEATWLEEAGTLETMTGADVGPAEGLSVSGQMVVEMSVVTTSVELDMGTTGTLDATLLDEATWLDEAGTLDTITGAEVGPAEGLSVSGQMVVLTSVVMTWVDSLGEGEAEDGAGAGMLETTPCDEETWAEEAGTLETMTGAEVGPADGLSVSGQMVVLTSVVTT